METNQETRIVPQSDRKASRIILVILLSAAALAVLTVIFVGAGYSMWAAYWGQRHSVLYDVSTVHVVRDPVEKNIYYVTYDVTVKNWAHDHTPHTYMLEDFLSGSPGGYDFTGGSEYFTTSNSKTAFQIKVRTDMKSIYWDYDPDIDPDADNTKINRAILREVIQGSDFMAYDEKGREDRSAMLFMEDYPDAVIIFE